MRGANCWTDHKLVRAKLQVQAPRKAGGGERSLPFAVHELECREKQKEYRERLERLLKELPEPSEGSLEEKWCFVKSCIVSAAEESRPGVAYRAGS